MPHHREEFIERLQGFLSLVHKLEFGLHLVGGDLELFDDCLAEISPCRHGLVLVYTGLAWKIRHPLTPTCMYSSAFFSRLVSGVVMLASAMMR